jgi:hypothetical protein
MKTSTLQNKIARAVIVDRQVAELTRELKSLKADLILEGLSRQDDHDITEGGGSSWTFEGADGCAVRVTYPAPKLRASLNPETKGFDKIRKLCGKVFQDLYTPAMVFKPVDKFRTLAVELLGKAAGNKLISATESDSAPQVAFETKEAA